MSKKTVTLFGLLLISWSLQVPGAFAGPNGGVENSSVRPVGAWRLGVVYDPSRGVTRETRLTIKEKQVELTAICT